MKISHLVVLATLSGFAAASQAQIVVKPTADQPMPYVTAAGNIVVKDSLGNCVRTMNYSTALIQSVLTDKGEPVGVACGEIKAEPKAAPAPAPVAPAAPKVVPVVPVPVAAPAAQKVSLPSDALFAFDKAELSDLGRDNLSDFANRAKGLKSLEVIIAVGHADRIGSAAYNQKLSEKRAAAVKDFLVGQGIPENKVYTEGKGSTQPVTGKSCEKLGAASGKNKKLVDCLAPDRRVELEAVGTK